MNERMQQLADQAEKYADNNFKGEPTYSEAYDSKFAELIVRECAAIALREDHDPADCILTHFGLFNTAKHQRPSPLDSSYPDGDGYWK